MPNVGKFDSRMQGAGSDRHESHISSCFLVVIGRLCLRFHGRASQHGIVHFGPCLRVPESAYVPAREHNVHWLMVSVVPRSGSHGLGTVCL